MTVTFVQEAAQAVLRDDIKAMMKKLAEYGLGICVPHCHDEETGAFKRLPAGIVQSESDLKVAFVRRNSLDEHDVPVAWIWDGEAQVIQSCQTCRFDGPHH